MLLNCFLIIDNIKWKPIPYDRMLEADEGLFDMPRIQINHPDYSDRCLGEIKENQPVKLIKTNSKEWRKHQRKIEFQLEYVLSKCHYAYVDWSQQWYFENKDQYDSEILLKTHKKNAIRSFYDHEKYNEW
ncbi:hypothetical protein GCK72_024889 [Caenorhabditis remanei]|uniref:Uncharacterized protein n=1 Tax=Caenorhabditis remanei TaxID=31234 RepID=A0A6A5G180_CAERE|nr:hypothetical protein GCK72_024889 [Caenorhabditis remanei]KAF1748422.1 hypothetical protein GCK72_024889 [Caenorhabditis remanei]